MCCVIPWICFGFRWQISRHACCLSLDLLGVHLSLSSTRSMASKRTRSQDTDANAAGTTVEWVSSSIPIYEDTKLYLARNIKLKWKEVNETFAGTFEEGLKDVRCTWTFTSLACTGLHANTPRSHARTWYTGLSLTLILRWWPWAMLVGWSLQTYGHKITMRCIRYQSLWLSWRLHSSYPIIVLTLEKLWRTG